MNARSSFGGVLRFRFADGYLPPVGRAFGVVLFDTRGPGDVTLEPAGNAATMEDVKLQLLSEAHLLSIQVVSAVPIPEPGAWALFAVGSLVLTACIRRRA